MTDPADAGARFIAGDDDAGERIDVVLARWLAEPRARASARIARGEVTVGGRVSKPSTRVGAGDEVRVTAPDLVAGDESDHGDVLPVRFEDEHVLVIAKPPGVVVHPGSGRASGTLVQTLVARGVPLAPAGGAGRPGIVHRLDRDTSGLLVVAKTDVAYVALVAALRARTVERRYVTLVVGDAGADRGRVEAAIARDPRRRTRFAALAGGKPATTIWTRLATGQAPVGPQLDLLVCRLVTGRTHQIRVHMAYAGHPVAGDPVYGARRDVATALGLMRPFLHAARLAFDHPVTGERVDVVEPLPGDLLGAAERAGVADQARRSTDDIA